MSWRIDVPGVVRVLEQRVLKAAARAEKRSTRLACVTNRRQRTIGVAIGTAGHTPDAGVGREQLLRIANRTRMYPVGMNLDANALGSSRQGQRNRAMSNHRFVVIADQCNVYHAAILS